MTTSFSRTCTINGNVPPSLKLCVLFISIQTTIIFRWIWYCSMLNKQIYWSSFLLLFNTSVWALSLLFFLCFNVIAVPLLPNQFTHWIKKSFDASNRVPFLFECSFLVGRWSFLSIYNIKFANFEIRLRIIN